MLAKFATGLHPFGGAFYPDNSSSPLQDLLPLIRTKSGLGVKFSRNLSGQLYWDCRGPVLQ